MPRPKRGDPELLLVSFCDIVTITTAAMFMAMIIVIDESMKIPVVGPTPMVEASTNAPVYFECRNNMVYPIDREGLFKVFQAKAEEFKSFTGDDMGERLAKLDAGNEIYRIDHGLAMMGWMGLQPRPDVKGVTMEDVRDSETNAFYKALATLNPNKQYCVFYVREDSFPVYRVCRDLCLKRTIQQGWEFLDRNEPITFEGVMRRPGVQ